MTQHPIMMSRPGWLTATLALLALALTLSACSGGENPAAVDNTGNNQNPPGDITGYTAELLMSGARLRALTGAGTNSVFAVSEDGMVFRRSSTGWAAELVPPSDDRPSFIDDIFAVSENAVFAVGNDAVLRYDGTRWHIGDPGSDITNSSAVWGDAADNVYIAGFQGGIYHWDGVMWTRMESGTGVWLESIWGGVLGSVFVGGRDGTLLELNGTDWDPIDLGVTTSVRGLWGIGNRLYIPLGAGVLKRYNGSIFEDLPTPNDASIVAMWGTSANTPYAIASGDVHRFNGTTWDSLDFPSGQSPFDIWGSAGDNIYVLTARETIYHYDGISWTEELKTESLGGWLAVFGFGDDNIFAGGQTKIAHYDGTDVSIADITTIRNGAIYGMWGSSANDVWAVGHRGTALRFGGSFWVAQNIASEPFLFCVTGTASDDVFAAGQDGVMFHWDGAAWTPMNSGTSEAILDMEALAADNVWAVGATGTILNYNGTNWIDHISPVATSLQSVRAFAPDDVWVYAGNGMIRFDGTSWSEVAIPPVSGRVLRGVSSSNMFVAGNDGAVNWFDGTDWQILDSFAYQPFQDMYVTPGASQVWTVTLGEGNIVKHEAVR